MSSLTPQEQYPKFYSKPHLWIDAIEVEVIISHTIYDGKGGSWSYNVGGRSRLNYPFFCEYKYEILKSYKPIFKPQEGDQFIKDFEDAVNSMFVSPNLLRYEGEILGEHHLWRGNVHFYIACSDLSIRCTSSIISIKVSLFVDRMRELGYYL